MNKKYINKIHKKHIDKKCYFCECDTYELLDVHRIVEGCNGGEYTENNTITVCSLCHRKIHCGLIKVYRKYKTSLGNVVLHYTDENGIEHFQ